jgi:hypothetical protein
MITAIFAWGSKSRTESGLLAYKKPLQNLRRGLNPVWDNKMIRMRMLILLSLMLLSEPVFAAETAKEPEWEGRRKISSSGSLKESLYTVETDDASSRDSLNRISGEIDNFWSGLDVSND